MKASGAVVLLVGMLLVSLLAGSVPCGSAFPYSDAEKVSTAVGSRRCCRGCVCTRSIPPQCHCTDVGTSCYSGCKACHCNWSEPPQCHCADVKPYCPRPCTHGSP